MKIMALNFPCKIKETST